MKKRLFIILAVISTIFLTPGCSYYVGDVYHNIFRGVRGIFTIVEPADTTLYRSILPDVYEMPETPLVAVFVNDNYDVEPWAVPLPLSPYYEASILLSCVYADPTSGESTTGWCPMTMPVSNQAANISGRPMGYPKYVADDMYLGLTSEGWEGETIHDNQSVVYLNFVEGPVDTSGMTGWQYDFMTEAKYINFEVPVINMVPPLKGPEIRIYIIDPPPLRTRRTGMLTINLGSPWNGLIPDNTVAPGFYQRFDVDG